MGRRQLFVVFGELWRNVDRQFRPAESLAWLATKRAFIYEKKKI
jgi:hypothetical protein